MNVFPSECVDSIIPSECVDLLMINFYLDYRRDSFDSLFLLLSLDV